MSTAPYVGNSAAIEIFRGHCSKALRSRTPRSYYKWEVKVSTWRLILCRYDLMTEELTQLYEKAMKYGETSGFVSVIK